MRHLKETNVIAAIVSLINVTFLSTSFSSFFSRNYVEEADELTISSLRK